jgi:hypothetical protein
LWGSDETVGGSGSTGIITTMVIMPVAAAKIEDDLNEYLTLKSR